MGQTEDRSRQCLFSCKAEPPSRMAKQWELMSSLQRYSKINPVGSLAEDQKGFRNERLWAEQRGNRELADEHHRPDSEQKDH